MLRVWRKNNPGMTKVAGVTEREKTATAGNFNEKASGTFVWLRRFFAGIGRQSYVLMIISLADYCFWQRTEQANEPYLVLLVSLPAKEFLIYVVLVEGSLSQKANSVDRDCNEDELSFARKPA